jgi:hypothetical protein
MSGSRPGRRICTPSGLGNAADLILACDMVVAASGDTMGKIRPASPAPSSTTPRW